jgi:hypothetical protein
MTIRSFMRRVDRGHVPCCFSGPTILLELLHKAR